MTGTPVGHGNVAAPQPVAVREVQNGPRIAFYSAVIALLGLLIVAAMQLVIMARWTGRMDTKVDGISADVREIRKTTEDQDTEINQIRVNDAKMLQMIQDHRDRSERQP